MHQFNGFRTITSVERLDTLMKKQGRMKNSRIQMRGRSWREKRRKGRRKYKENEEKKEQNMVKEEKTGWQRWENNVTAFLWHIHMYGIENTIMLQDWNSLRWIRSQRDIRKISVRIWRLLSTKSTFLALTLYPLQPVLTLHAHEAIK
jgi:hypothetical protein